MRKDGVPNRGQHAENHETRLGEKVEEGGTKLTCWNVGV